MRDSAARAAAIGLDARRLRVGAFGIAGAAAGLAGGVFAFAKGAVFPESLGIERSMDGLVMVLLGGVQSVAGPILGGVAYTVLYDALLGSAFWRAKLGVLIVLLVVLLPDGLAGRRR